MKKPTSLHVWYTNADTLTHDKIRELSMEISASNIPPDIIAITEIFQNIAKRYYKKKTTSLKAIHLNMKISAMWTQLEESQFMSNLTTIQKNKDL